MNESKILEVSLSNDFCLFIQAIFRIPDIHAHSCYNTGAGNE